MGLDVRNALPDNSNANIAQVCKAVNCPAGLLPLALILYPARTADRQGIAGDGLYKILLRSHTR